MKTYKILSALILISLMTACVKDLTDLNVNPNDPTSTDPNLLFTYALQQSMGNYNSDVNLEQWGLMNWTMFMAARGGIEAGKEYVIPSGKDDFWREQYSNALSNTQEIIDMAEGDPAMINMKAACIIWKINVFQLITDLWGNIPYSDALKGISGLNYSPSYDIQADIYSSMLDELKEATEMFTSEQDFFDPSSDLIYDGDIEKWKAFGNSLRLRLATRISNIDQEKYAEVLEELKEAELISSVDGSAIFPFNSVAKNHLWEVMFRGEAIVQNNPSKYLVDLLINSNDPRTPIFLEKAPLSFLPIYDDYKGVPNLLVSNDPAWDSYNPDGDWGDISRIGNWFLRNETPGVVMSHSEVCFLKAEAALNGLWKGSAAAFVAEGIRSNARFFNDYGDGSQNIDEDDIENYIANIGETDLEQIITQKWITFIFENGYEAYSEYRRTGYPVLKDFNDDPIDINLFPNRLIYPYSEYTLNRENYNSAVSDQGDDDEFTRIWWDVN